MEKILIRSAVSETSPADPEAAYAHFASGFRFETDCWDVHAALSSSAPDFVLFDVRSPEAFGRGHVEGAVNIPHRKIVAGYMAKWPPDTLFVVYCAGPHCNGAQRAAMRLAALKRPVKVMIGGISGWREEGFLLVNAPAAPT